jgi:hypothetical protein
VVNVLVNVPDVFAGMSSTPGERVPSKIVLCSIPELLTNDTVAPLATVIDLGLKVELR